jgi:hypothetical protein
MAGTAKTASKSLPLAFPARETFFAQSRYFLQAARLNPRLWVKVRPSNDPLITTHRKSTHKTGPSPTWCVGKRPFYR